MDRTPSPFIRRGGLRNPRKPRQNPTSVDGREKMKRQTLLISFLCCISLFANATDVPIKEGMSFIGARKALLQSGWQPNKTYSGEYGVENILVRKGFVEVESCSMGVQYCIFNYTKNNTCLGVSTVGEEVKDMRIYSWNFECPDVEQENLEK